MFEFSSKKITIYYGEGIRATTIAFAFELVDTGLLLFMLTQFERGCG